MKKTLLLPCLLLLTACGGSELDVEAEPSSEPAVSQQGGPVPYPYYSCTEECPVGMCVTGTVQSSACGTGWAYVCNDWRYYPCI
jgi:hypothetical protein